MSIVSSWIHTEQILKYPVEVGPQSLFMSTQPGLPSDYPETLEVFSGV